MNHRSRQLLISIATLALLIGACAPQQKKAKSGDEAGQQSVQSIEERARAFFSQGGYALAEGDSETALDSYLESARLYDRTNKVTVERADAHYEAASVAKDRLERELAAEEYDKSVQIYVRFEGNAKAKAAVALNNMGVIYKELADKNKARACWEKALEIYSSLPEEFQSQRNMAKIAQNIRDMDQGLY